MLHLEENLISMKSRRLNHVFDFLWDIWCLITLVGIWPRWLEPRALFTTRLKVAIDPGLKGLKIAFFSDLHLNETSSESFLKKIIHKTQRFKPDLIVFSGDFLCYSQLHSAEKFQSFFNAFSAPLGCFAALGNHDYNQSIGFNSRGDYDLHKPEKQSFIVSGFKRLLKKLKPTGVHSDTLSALIPHSELERLLKNTPFQLLHNQTVQRVFQGEKFNVTGVGEYSAGQCDPKAAFQGFEKSFSGIVLAHNPDALKALKEYPGDLYLSGHTHGGQINLPWIWKKLTVLENMRFKKGLFVEGDKKIYVTRGVGSVFSFRWFSPPELVLITLE